MKIDGLLTLIAVQIMGTVEGTPKLAEDSKLSKIQQTSNFRRVS